MQVKSILTKYEFYNYKYKKLQSANNTKLSVNVFDIFWNNLTKLTCLQDKFETISYKTFWFYLSNIKKIPKQVTWNLFKNP